MFDDEAYKTLIRSMQMRPLTYKNVADDWETRPDEWYHALIAIEDLPIVLAIPNLKVYARRRVNLLLTMDQNVTITGMDS